MARILIAGGGTAGHVVPALALADVLTEQGHEVVFSGSGRGLERDLVPAAGYSLHVVRVRGFERRLGLSTLRTVGSLALAAGDAWKLLRRLRPDCVVGVGAYASGPVVAEAAAMRIPTVAVEMDSHMGWTNRILSRLVDKVCLSFPDPERKGERYVYTGRPLRPSLLQAGKEEGLARFKLDPSRQVVLVVGGSLGARSLNQATVEAFAARPTPFHVIHVAGRRDFDWVQQRLSSVRVNPLYQVHAFLSDLPLALAVADVVVGRAGGSVAEVLARGVPSLLVPYPLAAGDHQTKNAQKIEEAGAAVVVADAELTPQVLEEKVQQLLDPEVNQRMRQAALQLARPDAVFQVCDIIVQLIARRTGKGYERLEERHH